MKYIITTSKNDDRLIKFAEKLSAELDILLISRDNKALESLSLEYDNAAIVVVESKKLTIWNDGKKFFYHPGMAALRILELRKGGSDHMVNAMNLRKNDTVLDCTLGLAADAVVASSVVGRGGKVTGIEYNPVVSKVVEYGLNTTMTCDQELQDAMRRIKVWAGDCYEYLYSLEEDSYDIVYFDPMFQTPIRTSSSLNSLRPFANMSKISPSIIKEALKVAKKRVVLKQRSESKEFVRLGFRKVVGGKNSPVSFGIIDK